MYQCIYTYFFFFVFVFFFVVRDRRALLQFGAPFLLLLLLRFLFCTRVRCAVKTVEEEKKKECNLFLFFRRRRRRRLLLFSSVERERKRIIELCEHTSLIQSRIRK